MASTERVKDVVWRISVLLQDTATQFLRWPEKELIQWLNDGQASIVKYLPLTCARILTVKLRAGTLQSIASIATSDCKLEDGSTPGATIYGTQFLKPHRNMGTDGATPGRAIRMVEADVLDNQDRDWHTRTDSIVTAVVYDPRTPRNFYVTPGIKSTSTAWMQLSLAAQPTAIPNTGTPGSELYAAAGSSTTTISIDDEFVPELVDYVVARANLKDSKHADKAAAQFHTERFLSSLNAKAAVVTGTNPNLTVLPGVTPQAA